MDKQDLRRLAHEATETEMDWLDRDWLAGIVADDWADYIVAAEPQVVIDLLDENERLRADLQTADTACFLSIAENKKLKAELDGLRKLIDTPHTDEWFQAVRLEAAHQINRWGTEQDAGKAPTDWFWLIGYLGGKALAASLAGNTEKAKHHTISSGAALLNWFRALVGDSSVMRPGIDNAKDEAQGVSRA